MKKKLLVLLMVFATMSMGVWAQTRYISGTVTSAEDGTTLPGVTVRVKDAPGGVTTNQNGQYQISVSSQTQTLVFFIHWNESYGGGNWQQDNNKCCP